MSQDLTLSTVVDERPGFHLRRVSGLAMAALGEALVAVDLRVLEATVLFEVAAKPGITLSDLGRVLGIKRANMTPLVAGLMARGYLASKRKDGRSQALSLSKTGEQIYDKARAIVEAYEQRFFAPLSEAEKQVMIRHLRTLWSSNQS